MSMTVREVRDWLASLDDTDEVAIDEGGLALVLVGDPRVYCEVGGEPLFEETESEEGS